MVKHRNIQVWFKNSKDVSECIRDLDSTLVKGTKWLFSRYFWPLFWWVKFLGTAQSLSVIGSSLKLNHHDQVTLAEIPDTHGRYNRTAISYSFLKKPFDLLLFNLIAFSEDISVHTFVGRRMCSPYYCACHGFVLKMNDIAQLCKKNVFHRFSSFRYFQS